MYRIFAKEILGLIEEIADRKGQGYRKARGIAVDMRGKLDKNDEDGVKASILSAYTFIYSPAWRQYTTDEDVKKANEIFSRNKEDNPDLCWDIEKNLKYSKEEAPQKKRLTIDDLSSYLVSEGVSVRRNLITHKVELEGWNKSGEYSRELQIEQFPVIVSDNLSETYTGSKPDDVARLIGVLAGMREYNPVLDLLRAEPWDGVDRLPDLFGILGVTDDLSRMLLEKWMRQAVSLQFNDLRNPFGGEGVLVLTGPQGCGKSEFSKRIAELSGAGGFFLPGALLDPQDKDSVIQATSRWIVEIGELGATFNKADMGRLKAFITKPFDTYRVPFGREDVSTLRRTSFIATVDRADFLTDDSGNRRWWVVEVERIDLDALDKLDRVQLWRQIVNLIDRDGIQSFRLTREERDKLNQRNRQHEKLIPAEQELRDILAECNGEVETGRKFEIVRMSAGQIGELYGLRYTAAQIGTALNRIGIENGRGAKGARWYLFPRRKFTSPSING